MTTSEGGISHEASTQAIPGPIHKPNAPNWALATSAPTDETHKYKKGRSRNDSQINWAPRGKGARRGSRPAYNRRQSRDGHPRFQTVHNNVPDNDGTPGRPHLQMHLAQNNIAINALENALFQDINRKRHSQKGIPGVGEVSAAMKFARICNADLRSVFCLINSACQKEQTAHRQTLDASRPVFVPGKPYELRTVSDWNVAPSAPPNSPHRGKGGGIRWNASRSPNMKWVRSPGVTASPVSIENPAPNDFSITSRDLNTLTNDGVIAKEASEPPVSPAFGISSLVETIVAQQTTEPFIQAALQAPNEANVSMDFPKSDTSSLHPAVAQGTETEIVGFSQ